MKATSFEDSAWQCTKIGAGPIPILTDDGWLMIYHGVINTCNGFRYAMGAAILDEHQPDKVKYRTQDYLLSPSELYEQVGDVNNVIFPCAALHDIKEDKIVIYYGAADTVVALAFGHISELVKYTKDNSL
jgi:beta-1,4-mannooligosaccharide/beta-1,4-mannosyl-N-acetylglucosamine phosphorylase